MAIQLDLLSTTGTRTCTRGNAGSSKATCQAQHPTIALRITAATNPMTMPAMKTGQQLTRSIITLWK